MHPLNDKLKKKYVKSPFTTLQEVKSYVQTISNDRKLKKNDYTTSLSYEMRLDTPEPDMNPNENENDFFLSLQLCLVH